MQVIEIYNYFFWYDAHKRLMLIPITIHVNLITYLITYLILLVPAGSCSISALNLILIL